MKDIQMVDLLSQYEKIQPQIDKGVIEVIQSSMYINGPEVKNFQKELENYLGVKHVIPCANGTDALQIALMALDLQPGDEVITSDFTFAATVEVIALLKLKPVLVDVDYNNFNISTEAIRKAITPKTKAIIPVHLFGQCANMEEILKIAQEFNLKIVEDAAQSIGSDFIFSDGKRQKSGTIGDIGTTSFFPSKNLGCYGDGGAIFTNNDEIAQIIRGLVNHGMYERYHHDKVGVNSRLDSLQAVILRAKLPHLDTYNAHRRRAANFYNEAFKDIKQIVTPKNEIYSCHVYHQYTLKLKGVNREALKNYLMENKIPAMIYYPIPLRKQNAYKDFCEDIELENTDLLCKEVLSLPMHSELTEDQLEYITSHIINFLKNK